MVAEAAKIKCPICQVSDYQEIRRGIRHFPNQPVYECSICGLQFLDPPAEDVRDYYTSGEYRRMHSGGANHKNIFTAEGRFTQYRPFMAERRDDPHVEWKQHYEVLDIGCSSGYFLDSLKGRVRHRLGLEWNPVDAAYANTVVAEAGQKAVDGRDISELSQKPGFHVICAFHVLEHTADPLKFLIECRKRLKSEGHLYIDVPNLNDVMLTTIKPKQFSDFWYRAPHIWNFTRDTLFRLLVKAGLVGDIWSTEEYSLANTLHWMKYGKPAANPYEGRRVPRVDDDKPYAIEVNEFMQDADETWRRGIGLLGIGGRLRAWMTAI